MLHLNSCYFLIEALIELKLGVTVGRGSSTCIKKKTYRINILMHRKYNTTNTYGENFKSENILIHQL